MRRPGLFQRSIAALLFTLQLAGCTSWHVESLPPAELIAQRHPYRLRVQDEVGKRVMIYGPEVRGDSLVGRPSAGSTGSRAVPLATVRSVATSHFSAGGTLALLLGVGVLAVVALAVVISSSDIGLAN